MSFHGLEREISELKAQFDLQEVVKRAVKYLIEGACVAVAAFYIPQVAKGGAKSRPPLDIEDIILIAITAAATFAILDMYSPSIGSATRQGAGIRCWC